MFWQQKSLIMADEGKEWLKLFLNDSLSAATTLIVTVDMIFLSSSSSSCSLHIDDSVQESCNCKKADLKKLHKKIDKFEINPQFTESIEH